MEEKQTTIKSDRFLPAPNPEMDAFGIPPAAPIDTEQISNGDWVDRFHSRNPEFVDSNALDFALNPFSKRYTPGINKDRGKMLVASTVILVSAGYNVVQANLESTAQASDLPSEHEYIESEVIEELGVPQETVIEVERPSISPEFALSTEQVERIERVLQEQTPDALNHIIELKPIYEEAARQTGIDWKYIAANHFREDNNNPNSSAVSGEPLGTGNYEDGEIKGTNNLENFIASALIFIKNARYFYNVDVKSDNLTPEQQMSALLAYNRGHRYSDKNIPPETVAQVVNYLDSDKPMRRFSDLYLEPESSAGNLDLRPGSYTFFLFIDYLESIGFFDNQHSQY